MHGTRHAVRRMVTQHGSATYGSTTWQTMQQRDTWHVTQQRANDAIYSTAPNKDATHQMMHQESHTHHSRCGDSISGPQYPAPAAAGVGYCKILNQNPHKPQPQPPNNTPQTKTVNEAPQTKTRTLEGVPKWSGCTDETNPGWPIWPTASLRFSKSQLRPIFAQFSAISANSGRPMKDQIGRNSDGTYLGTIICPEVVPNWYPTPTAVGVGYCKILNQNPHKPPTTNLLNNTPQTKTMNEAPQTKTHTLEEVPNGTGPNWGILYEPHLLWQVWWVYAGA
ncbi:hypothetical protein BS47DRAFT_1364571 [Hydnum rufescens UP504]|uniref:Uncharacterized protein n=1 Tax=Hydnum rufescens UP504 TaxID=1448309 RepID=A0A9P6DPT0_9AGAM|nr:hypothetical protein BS47DRAFT_1364571 [Hydnum rufescens UP504]